MNFDGFARQMTLKYQIAIATAIIKSKPSNIPIDKYINRLRNKIDKKMDFDSDITICSDDFNFDDDTEVNDDRLTLNGDGDEGNVMNDSQETNVSVNLLKGFNMDVNMIENNETTSTFNLPNEKDNQLNYKIGNKERCTDSTFCEDTQSQKLLDDNVLFVFDVNQTTRNEDNFSKKGENCHKENVESYHFNEESMLKANNDQNLPFDSQQTELYDFRGFNSNIVNDNLNRNINRQVNPNHLSGINRIPTQINFENIPFTNNVNDERTIVRDVLSELPFDSQKNDFYNINGSQTTTKMNFRETKNTQTNEQFIVSDNLNKNILKNDTNHNENITFDSQQTTSYYIHGYDGTNKHGKDNFNDTKSINDKEKYILTNIIRNANINDVIEKTLDSQQTELNSAQDFNENYTISQSQTQFVEIQKNQLYRTKDKNLKQKQVNNNTENNNTFIKEPIYENLRVDTTQLLQNKGDVTTNEINNIPKNINKNKEFKTIDVLNYNSQADRQEQNNDAEMYDSIDNNCEMKNSQVEIVPYKVMTELNRLKTYLERKNKDSSDGTWSDSGYRSDSQSRSSFKLHLQTQDKLVNHSAGSILDFILTSPLVLTSKEITNEVSLVLGRLIDKLYVEEKYFLFLEDVLRSIDNLLKDIQEGQSYDEDVIIKKDESINRLLLLNRSCHTVKYTIEKIGNILEKFLSQITNGSVLEITNTKETENLSYILHILECLLKRYTVIKNQKNSQSIPNTQSTQEEKYLKKSSISDIWRKKWNPNYKTVNNDSMVDKKCIELKCMEILNKIIVQAMDGYSLISFAALQCFNLLQS